MGRPSGVVTFLFTDIESSTSLWERQPDAMRDALERHDALIRAAAADHDGHVFATMGDGFGVAFDRPSAAVDAALDAQARLTAETWPDSAELRVRMGLHLGEAHERDGDYFGPTVNLTARVMSAGHGGQILASPAVQAMVRSDVGAVELGTHRLAGVAEPQPIVQLGDADPAAFPPLRTSHEAASPGRDGPVLLERDEPLAVLQGCLTQASGGQGSLVLVAGAAGTGKSSLVNEAIRRAGDVVVLRGGCDPLSAPRPLGPLREIAMEPGADIGSVTDVSGDLFDVYERFLVRLKSPPGPVLVVLEDIHWADDATLDLIQYLARRVGRSRSVVVCTFRDDQVDADDRLLGALGMVTSLPDVERLEMQPLSISGVQLLIGDDESRDVQALFQATSGNPFFVTEVLASGDAVPSSVTEAVLARVRPLPPGARAAIEAVSIAPRAVDMITLRRLPGVEVDGIDIARDAGILQDDAGSLRFRHDLARVAVEQSLKPGRRISLHQAMLEQRRQAPNPDLAEIAHHAIGTEDPQVVLDEVPAAATQAMELGATLQAAALFDASVAAAERLDQDRAAELNLELAHARFNVGERDRGEAALDRAMAHYSSTDDVAAMANVVILRAGQASNAGGAEQPIALLEQAIEILAGEPAGPQLVSAHLGLARIGIVLRDGEMAKRHQEQASAIHGEVDSTKPSPAVELSALLVELAFGDFERASESLLARRVTAEREGDDTSVITIDSYVGTAAGEFRRYGVAMERLEQGVELSLERDLLAQAGYDGAWLAKVYVEVGDFARAEATLLARPATTGIEGAKHLTALGRLRIRRGDPGGVEALRQGLALVDGDFLQHRWPLMAGLAEHLWVDGRSVEIPDVIGETYELALRLDSAWARGELGFWMWKAGAITEPPDGAADPYALQIAGDWRTAAQAWERIGAPFERALALVDGDASAAAEAVAILDGLGAVPAADRVRRDLRDAGRHTVPRGPNTSTRANPFGLTRRQAEVLDLLAEGLTNAEIADQLVVSKRTVEHHVSAVFSQLGVTTRSKAIAVARTAGDPAET